MKISAILIVVSVLIVFTCEAASKQVSCEYIHTSGWGATVGSRMTCFMQRSQRVTIDAQGFTIASSKKVTIGGLNFYGNKQVSFLPVNVHGIFPNLMGLHAGDCSIKTISKENFKNLNKLKLLFLDGNQIKKIRTNVFEDLTSLEHLKLFNNKIKSMDGLAFQHLKKLRKVDMNGNECIDESFDGSNMKMLIRVVSRNCGTCGSDDPTVMKICENSDQIKELLEAIVAKAPAIEQKTAEIEQLNAKLYAAETAKNLAETQKLHCQRVQTFGAKPIDYLHRITARN